MNILDIGSKSPYPANALSNFAAHPFIFDGVSCGSMEGFLQSLKFDKVPVQVEVCKLVGYSAKKRGSARTKHWQQKQVLWWADTEYPRESKEYQELLDRAFSELCKQSLNFRSALSASGNKTLTHQMGRTDPKQTVLTRSEFCDRLMSLRQQIS